MNRSKLTILLSAVFLYSVLCAIQVQSEVTSSMQTNPSFSINLAGEWDLQLDPQDQGIREKWFLNPFETKVQLPGSLDAQRLGNPPEKDQMGRLTKESWYVGPAWYRKKVHIPEEWSGKQIHLVLERCHWETQIWVDGYPVGMKNSLSVPHIHDLTDWLTPGEHDLVIRVDNTIKINVGHTFGNWKWAHSVTDETQTNWNGIIGKIALEAFDPIFIESLQIYPDFDKKIINCVAIIQNQTSQSVSANSRVLFDPSDHPGKEQDIELLPGKNTATFSLDFASTLKVWDEFSPHLYQVSLILSSTNEGHKYQNQFNLVTGFRDFRIQDKQFLLNNRRVFLRGNLECCIFPLTGYPPMEVKDWLRIMEICKVHGLNHLRFHSWCPPKAAFEAADQMGFIFQIEAPVWDGYGGIGYDPVRAAWIIEEVDRIVDTYGNHPSFCLMSMGNELGDGKEHYLQYLVDYLRRKDPRHYYTCTTHPADLSRNDDYFASAGTNEGITRGFAADVEGRLSNLHDFGPALAQVDRPYLSHEVGQPCMFPNFEEIGKYTGHLKPKNLESFRKSFADHHLLDLAEPFRQSTGALAVAIYKENIEALLRTPGLDGFQLLGIQDFPGQGTALIGILDPFWDSKGLITPEDFRKFCGPTVPLLRMKNNIWTTTETLIGDVEVAHYGPADLAQNVCRWNIKKDQGDIVSEGTFTPCDIPTGGNTRVGTIQLDLSKVQAPCYLKISVSLDGTEFENTWDAWVYPAGKDVHTPETIQVTEQWNEETFAKLAQGGKVLLNLYTENYTHALPAQWNPVFWCYQLFSSQKQTMGILCNPNHPALAGFPTEEFGNFQWYDLLNHSIAFNLDQTPTDYRPLIHYIHDFNFNSKLGCLFEMKVGQGSLLVCSIDLMNNLEHRPEARSLRKSLIDYMTSEAFNPSTVYEKEALDNLFAPIPRNENVVEGGPADLDQAVLQVDAAVHADIKKTADWSPQADMVLKQSDGFTYQIQGGVWRDGIGSAWHNQRLIIEVQCPIGFTGTLYLFMHDWSKENRNAALFFEGRDLGPLGRHDKKGIWLKLPVRPGEADDGKLVFDARTTSGPNIMVSKLVLVGE